ncbi:hypothetical protein A0J61_07415 [Choanephora cucurbitarum]|uniref:BZIP domain-containing protein n=1 Tax=Choanephora cucurbitarum TaxID=101091 RepID=A0A1C7N5W2_9FUNG|nr:hypothetical protein A0J61_07415 [Choanephora cucurbitarum]
MNPVINHQLTYPFLVTGYDAQLNQAYTPPQQPNSPDPLTVNDWLNQLIVNPDLMVKEETPDFNHLFQFLPISPPLTTSPGSVHQDMTTSHDPLVALFPDILNTNLPPPRPVVVPRKTVPIMPKTSNVVPIAPRPGGFTPPITNKRKSENVESDEAAQKRQKNTDAARRSRLKKIIKMETLEKQVTELESDNARLTTRVAVLESEKSALVSKDKDLEERIRVLEAQLAEAHRALTTTA